MTKPDHNNRHFPENQPILVLGDLLDFIASSDLAASEKATLISALRRTDQLIGHGALDIPADARKVLADLEAYSPAMAGMTAGSYANLKSRVRKCFRLAEPYLANPRKRPPLTSAWTDLQDRLSVGDQRNLSRFFHFVSDAGSGPERVDDALLERFTAHLRDQALVLGWDDVVRNTIRAWNRSVVPQGAGQFKPLTPPPPKRTRYWIEQAEWPAPLRADTDWLLQTMSKPLVFSKTKARQLKPATVHQYRYLITTLVSACRESGLPWSDLDRLSKLVSPGTVEVAMTFLAQRLGKPASVGMVTMMGRICVIAELCKLPPDDLKELEGLYRDVDAAAFKTGKRRQLTEKNRSLLDRLDDQQFCDLVITLPQQILAWAQKHPGSRLSATRSSSSLAETTSPVMLKR